MYREVADGMGVHAYGRARSQGVGSLFQDRMQPVRRYFA